MASPHETASMALFCDFENVALGVRDANYEKFDIKRVLERLLLKGSIVVKKAYCDWDRYKGFKATMHEANFELIEIPHVRQSGKNSADIRLVVDALDLCYTKSHVNTFVIISGDSDFSPLVSKLRENAKQVIGVGVKQSTSDLLIANCDEFIFYDDLVRESQRAAAKRDTREAQPAAKRSPDEEKGRKDEQEARKTQAIELAVDTFDALVAERGDSGKIWASMLKEAIKRRKPGFNESYYGFRAFGNLLEEAQARGLLEFGRDEKSGAYVYRSNGGAAAHDAGAEPAPVVVEIVTEARAPASGRHESRRGRGSRKPADTPSLEAPASPEVVAEPAIAEPVTAEPVVTAAPAAEEPAVQHEPRRRSRGGRKQAVKPTAPALAQETAEPETPAAPVQPQPFAVPPPLNVTEEAATIPAQEPTEAAVAEGTSLPVEAHREPEARRKGRGPRKPAAKKAEALVPPAAEAAAEARAPTESPVPAEPPAPAVTTETVAKAARKPASRSRRPRKQEVADAE
ncbi:NYN domain-containing protein [Aromatoleum buckelii]|uniref:NYN domain-containing protein n=1 Tax=Aromatoleum buckelii TaxID=200254 RepID=A0ABX1MZ60_9RHOO|nr:NYN domain-containing protein [Aromatoleum buckelii]MCK0510132.1 NYN domain-containing protein [Aromatoleum buckelii]